MKLKILIVDDDFFMRLSLKDLLEQNHEIDLAENGEECLKKLENNQYDLVILDTEMPKLGGFSTLVCLKKMEIHRYLPICMMSLHVDFEHKNKAMDFGAMDLLFKPLHEEDILRIIEEVIEMKKRPQIENALIFQFIFSKS
jgi:PleD family two-component response regulator